MKDDVENVLEKVVGRLAAAYGPNLVCIILYGSAASGEYHQGTSDLNLVCVLKEITVPVLQQASRAIQPFVDEGNPSPTFLTEDEVRTACDVFPIEFMDMQLNHQVLAGHDIFAGLSISRHNHRLELEHELRSKYLGLRQRYLLACNHPRGVQELIFESLPAFVTLFRHVLILMGERVPIRKRDVIELFCSKSGHDSRALLRLLESKEKGEALKAADVVELFPEYLRQLSSVVQFVDELP